jgi:hypothetical protein
VTPAEIVEATGWQNHTVLGFVSILGIKGGLKIESGHRRILRKATRSSSAIWFTRG